MLTATPPIHIGATSSREGRKLTAGCAPYRRATIPNAKPFLRNQPAKTRDVFCFVFLPKPSVSSSLVVKSARHELPCLDDPSCGGRPNLPGIFGQYLIEFGRTWPNSGELGSEVNPTILGSSISDMT